MFLLSLLYWTLIALPIKFSGYMLIMISNELGFCFNMFCWFFFLSKLKLFHDVPWKILFENHIEMNLRYSNELFSSAKMDVD